MIVAAGMPSGAGFAAVALGSLVIAKSDAALQAPCQVTEQSGDLFLSVSFTFLRDINSR